MEKIPFEYQQAILKTSTDALRKKLLNLGYKEEEVGAMDRKTLMDLHAEAYLASIKAEGEGTGPEVMNPESPGMMNEAEIQLRMQELEMRKHDRELEREKMELEKMKLEQEKDLKMKELEVKCRRWSYRS